MSKLKAVAPKTAEPSKPKLLLFGPPGVGKTYGSLDFPNVYYIDAEGGATRSHYTDKLDKAGGMYFGPEQGSQIFDEVLEQIKALATEKHGFKTLVIDSYTKLFNIEIAKEQEKLGDKDAFGASKKPAVAKSRSMIAWLDRLDMNVILICHEKAEWANGEQTGVTFDGWDKLGYELDLVMQIKKQGDSRKAFIRKSRLEGFPEATMIPWGYDEFAKRYGVEVIERDSKPVDVAKPEQLAELSRLLEIIKIDQSEQDKWLSKAGVEQYSDMDSDKVAAIIAMLKKKLA